MDSKKYIGMDVHKESISIAVMNGAGKIVMECVIETESQHDFAVYRWAARRLVGHLRRRNLGDWLYDLLKPQVTKLAGGASAK